MKRSPRVLSGSLVLVLLILILALLGGGAWLVLKLRQPKSPLAQAPQMTAGSVSPIPAFFEKDLPESCRQVALVVSPEDTSVTAELFLMVRNDARSPWTVDQGPIPVTLGRSGLAWGVGEHRASRPEGFREKREGDGCSPAGIFRVPFVFGMAPEADARVEAPALTLPYTHLADSIIGVDDPDSHYYNQVVDSNLVPRDWNSHEPMNRFKVLYRWGAFIAHNPEGVPNLGSCIFIHIWPGPGEPTAGCTGMADADVVRVLTWLDPAKEPRLVQGLKAWCETSIDSHLTPPIPHEGDPAPGDKHP
jgi:L,D-peptidoglycan transpeptidase YkuD (ErfK/YbiS/YcfS/YnhG family)